MSRFPIRDLRPRRFDGPGLAVEDGRARWNLAWYPAPKYPGAMVGDEAFDALHALLLELSRCYLEGVGRRPRLDELRALLEIGLRVSGGELLADLDDRAVDQVAIRTRKKPRSQPCALGDVVAVPLGDRRYAFGRLMFVNRSKDILIEVFRQTGSSASYRSSIPGSGRLLHPVRVAGARHCLGNWRWPVVASDPGYRPPIEEVKALEFVDRTARNDGWCLRRWGGARGAPVSEPEAFAKLDDGWHWGFLDEGAIEKMIARALDRAAAPGASDPRRRRGRR